MRWCFRTGGLSDEKTFRLFQRKDTAICPGQLNLFNEAEVYQTGTCRKKTAARSHVHGRKKATPCGTFKGLKVHKEVIPLDEEDKVCPYG